MNLSLNRLSCRSAGYLCRQICLSPLTISHHRLFRTRPTHFTAANSSINIVHTSRKNLRHFSDSIQKETKCWNCGDKKSARQNNFFCGICGFLQDVDKTIDYFNLFSLENKFKIDLNVLSKKFRKLQTLVHPDKFGNKTEREKQNSSDWSSFINEANKTLGLPIDRGQYLLKIQGFDIPEDNSSVDNSFLLEMMELNESVEDANTKVELENLLIKSKNDIDKQIDETEKWFDANDYSKAKHSLIKVKYFNSLQNSIKNKLEKFLVEVNE